MDVQAVFGLSAFLSLVSSGVIAWLYVWPWLQLKSRKQALTILLAPQMFVRSLGLSFLVVGVVSPSLPAAFAIPAAYGDLVAAILAIVAVIALARDRGWAIAATWLFNVWGAADLLYALYQGPHLQIPPSAFGAAFYLPTGFVPALLVTHFLVFRLLVGKGRS
jgi:hypothetical protein